MYKDDVEIFENTDIALANSAQLKDIKSYSIFSILITNDSSSTTYEFQTKDSFMAILIACEKSGVLKSFYEIKTIKIRIDTNDIPINEISRYELFEIIYTKKIKKFQLFFEKGHQGLLTYPTINNTDDEKIAKNIIFENKTQAI